ncbi:hypothetical protein ACO0LF_03665 [Undibacterium sp. Di27W]|uniref:hypothetical protein n=1 Tax=Undibacterium sp. Di27W TaxID=3413036 RepID=UPI003BF027A5
MIDLELEKRLMNWRNTVLGGIGGGGGACCASWAAAYIAARNKQEEALAIALEINQPCSALIRFDVNELDGWLVEAAVRTLIDHDQKQVLRLKFVWEYPDHWIKTKLHIRDAALRIVFGRAITNLKTVLDKLKSPDTIRTHNSHAGIVPRPDATVVPLGAAAPVENAKP